MTVHAGTQGNKTENICRGRKGTRETRLRCLHTAGGQLDFFCSYARLPPYRCQCTLSISVYPIDISVPYRCQCTLSMSVYPIDVSAPYRFLFCFVLLVDNRTRPCGVGRGFWTLGTDDDAVMIMVGMMLKVALDPERSISTCLKYLPTDTVW